MTPGLEGAKCTLHSQNPQKDYFQAALCPYSPPCRLQPSCGQLMRHEDALCCRATHLRLHLHLCLHLHLFALVLVLRATNELLLPEGRILRTTYYLYHHLVLTTYHFLPTTYDVHHLHH